MLNRSNQLWRRLLIAYLHNHLRIIGLGRFGSDGKPEAWAAATDKTRHGSQEVLCSLLHCFPFWSSFNNLAYNLLRSHSRIVCRAQWHVIRQPDVEVKPILDILGKKL